MCPLAEGTDLGGSLRGPASYCGAVGFRTTPGLIPRHPSVLAWDTYSVEGPMARTVADAALMEEEEEEEEESMGTYRRINVASGRSLAPLRRPGASRPGAPWRTSTPIRARCGWAIACSSPAPPR